MASILHLDDNPKALRFLGSILRRSGYNILTATSPENALGLLQTDELVLILLAGSPSCPGDRALASAIRSLNPCVPIVMYSRHRPLSTDHAVVVDAYVDGAQPIEELIRTIRHYIRNRCPVLAAS